MLLTAIFPQVKIFVAKKIGIYYVNKCLYEINVIDCRTEVLEIYSPSILTNDNVQLEVRSYVKFKVVNPYKAYYQIADFRQALDMLAQGVKKNTLVEYKMSEILHKTREFSTKLQRKLARPASAFGVQIDTVEVTNISLPADMIIPLAQAAMAERDKDAKIKIAQGDLESAKMLKEAAEILDGNKKSVDLRYLELLKEMSSESSHITITPDAMLTMSRY